ncbi:MULTISPECIES: MATE family efflux transporter [unclassified Francisella]|uniref:MATE family efflux transporter n=1 Tax=unclassified Francisella TaxID=2610885 RepID=UPI002E301C61|nr:MULTISPECIES: MATE family efflux transporter [unclassified Francisella]MED7818388.1 MATE family efflux transporter [Francisella sp. 19S2-4]MED7829224.1 MATE family efflux transporter [Francisella sp. 19S2-10]
MHRKIFLLSLPLIFSNLVLSMVGIVNTAIIGHLNNSSYLAAIGLGVSILNVICLLFAFFRMSLTGLIAQNIDDIEKMFRIVLRAIIVASIISIIIFILKPFILNLVLSIIHIDSIVKTLFIRFYNIAIYVFWFALLNFIFLGFFIGIGKTKVVLYSSLILMIFATSSSVFWVIFMQCNVTGVAISLVSAYCVTTIFLFIKTYRFFVGRGVLVKQILKEFDYFTISEYIPFLKLNTNIFIRSLCLLLSMNSFYIFSAQYGKDILAANTILIEVSIFMAMFLDALANTTESLVAQAYVDNDQKIFKEVVSKTLLQSLVITFILVFIYACFKDHIVTIFTSLVDVKYQVNKYILFSILIPIVASFSFWIDGVFVGLLKTVAMRNAMILAALVYIVSVFLLQGFENYGLWIALILFYIARTVFLIPPLRFYLSGEV